MKRACLCRLLQVIGLEDKRDMNSTWKALATAVVVAVMATSTSGRAEALANPASTPSEPKPAPEGTPDGQAKRAERFLNERQESRFSSEAEKRASAYKPFLTELGLTSDEIATVLARLDGLLRAAVRAGDPLAEVVIARAEYAGDLKTLLGDPGFAEYEALEMARPYRSTNQRADYASFLSEHGLSRGQIEATLDRLDALVQREIKAGGPMQQLSTARGEYLGEIKAMLGDIRFAKYETFEMAKPYRREADYIEEYAAKRNVIVDRKSMTRLVELLREFRLHTTETWDGPYDPLPRPLAGAKSIVANIDEYTSRISMGLPAFMANASTELSPELVGLVSGYYSIKLREFAESRARAFMTREERMAEVERRMEEIRLRAKAKQGRSVPDL